MGRKADLRAAKAKEAHDARYAYVTIVYDREEDALIVQHEFVSFAETASMLTFAVSVLEVERGGIMPPIENY